MKISSMLTLLLAIFCSSNVMAQDLSLAGTPNKATYNADTKEYTLTTATTSQAGSIWSKDYIDLHDNFVIKASIYLGANTPGNYGDGIAFVLQPLCTGLGVQGSGLGYQGVTPSFAIEFDNVSNPENKDPKDDHIGFMINGNPKHDGANDLGTTPDGKELENGKHHDITIEWNSKTHTMTLKMDHKTFTSKPKNLVADVFNNNGLVYWGFTASTGLWVNEHKVKITEAPARNIVPYNVTDASNNMSNGSIEVTMSSPGLTYKWSNNKTGKSIDNLKAGTYKVTITNSESCESVFDIKVNNLPDLIGHWTFEPGNERNDLVKNFETLTLIGGATISDGRLNVSQAKWAVTNMVTSKVVTEKTLVAWVIIDDVNARGGSAITYETGNRDFDGIVYAERTPKEWMSGSGMFARTDNPNGGSKYTTTKGKLVKVAITYAKNNTITIYVDGKEVNRYTKGKMIQENNQTDNTASVLFGMRHTPMSGGIPGGGAWFVGQIEEARIYGGVLLQDQIANLTLTK